MSFIIVVIISLVIWIPLSIVIDKSAQAHSDWIYGVSKEERKRRNKHGV